MQKFAIMISSDGTLTDSKEESAAYSASSDSQDNNNQDDDNDAYDDTVIFDDLKHLGLSYLVCNFYISKFF